MSHHDLCEQYHEYVQSLADDDENAGLLVDFLFELVERPASQVIAWAKGAAKSPDETLSGIMGGLDFADWQAKQESERTAETAERRRETEIQDATNGRR